MNHLHLSVYCFQCKKRILHDAPATADRDLEFIIGIKVGEFQNVCQFALCPGDAGMLGNFRNIMFAVAGSLLASINISAEHKSRTDSEVSELS